MRWTLPLKAVPVLVAHRAATHFGTAFTAHQGRWAAGESGWVILCASEPVPVVGTTYIPLQPLVMRGCTSHQSELTFHYLTWQPLAPVLRTCLLDRKSVV